MTRPDRSRLDDPTAENEADPVQLRNPPLDEFGRRTAEAHDSTPRRYEQPADDDPIVPSEDPSLNTKI